MDDREQLHKETTWHPGLELAFSFLPLFFHFVVKRYVPCSLTARQPWLVAVFGTPSHGL